MNHTIRKDTPKYEMSTRKKSKDMTRHIIDNFYLKASVYMFLFLLYMLHLFYCFMLDSYLKINCTQTYFYWANDQLYATVTQTHTTNRPEIIWQRN